MKKDPIKNEGMRVATRLYVDFSDVQVQITPLYSQWLDLAEIFIQAFMHGIITCKN